jgi:tetratricopeptide (TPR) repeat protein
VSRWGDQGERIRARLPDGGAAWLSEIGHPSPASVLEKLPDRFLAEPDPLRLLAILRDLAAQAGDLRVAVGTGRAVVAALAAERGKDHVDTWFETAVLGALLDRVRPADEGLRLLDAAHRRLEPLGRDLRVAVAAQHLGAALVRAGRWPLALAPLQRAVELRRALAPDTVGLASAQLGELLVKLGRPADAVRPLTEAHALTARQEGPSAPRTLARAQVLGTTLVALERYPEAVQVLRPVLEHLPPDELERRAAVAFELGLALDRSGSEEEAVRRVEEAVRSTRQLSDAAGLPNVALANRLGMMAQIHLRRGRGAEAEGLMLEALEAERRLHGDDSPEVAAMTAQLGHFCYRMGRRDEAVGWMDTATSLVETALGPEHPQTVAVADAHVALLLEVATAGWASDPEGSRALAERAFEVGGRLLGHAHARTRAARDLLARPARR